MCMSCGCGTDDDHGDDRHITYDDIKAAADAADITPARAVKNIAAAAPQKSGGSSVIRKSFTATTKVLDADQGIAEAIVNCTAITDLQRDIMEPGCFGEVIKSAKAGDADFPSLCWGHAWEVTTGKVVDMEELRPGDQRLGQKLAQAGAGGLRIVGQYNLETQRGREAFSDVKFGAIKQWSIGFIAADDGVKYDEKGIRRISKVALLPEVSNVLVGASPGTFTSTAKSGEEPADRKARSEDRYRKAVAIANDFKSTLDTQAQREGAKYSMRDADGAIKFPINDCEDCKNAWNLRGSSSIPKDKVEAYVRRTAAKLKCDGPWNDGKAVDLEHEEKAPGDTTGIPTMTGDEAPHNGPLRVALSAIDTLIGQELAEDNTEYDDIVRLAFVAMDLLRWAQGETGQAPNYGMVSMYDAVHAGIPLLTKTEDEQPADQSAGEPPSNDHIARYVIDGLQAAAAEAIAEAFPASPQHNVPEHSDEVSGLTSFARRSARPRFGG